MGPAGDSIEDPASELIRFPRTAAVSQLDSVGLGMICGASGQVARPVARVPLIARQLSGIAVFLPLSERTAIQNAR